MVRVTRGAVMDVAVDSGQGHPESISRVAVELERGERVPFLFCAACIAGLVTLMTRRRVLLVRSSNLRYKECDRGNSLQ